MVGRYGGGAVAALLFTLAIWSTTFAGLRAGLEYFSPGHLVLLRWGGAGLLLLVYGAFTGMRRPARADLGPIVLSGLLGFGAYQIALAYGQTGLTAGTAGLLINLAPAFTLLLAVALRTERVTSRMWAGLAVSLAGVVMLGAARGGFGGNPVHALAVAAAALSFAGYVHVTKPLLRRYSPLEVTTYAICAGVLPLAFWAPGAASALAEAPLAGKVTLAYLAVFPAALSYVSWSRAIVSFPASVAARGLYLVPVVGLGVAWAWLGEVPSVMAVVGGLVVIAGVMVASTRSRGQRHARGVVVATVGGIDRDAPGASAA